MSEFTPRSAWAALPDAALLAQCDVDAYRASGPGGQKRNKTSSAVRLRHAPTGLLVIAEESRSQHENKAKALTRLRRAFYLQLREPLVDLNEWDAVLDGSRRVAVGPKSAAFWPAAGAALDALHSAAGQVSTAAAALGVSTGQLVSFLELHPRLWQAANELRTMHGQKRLHSE